MSVSVLRSAGVMVVLLGGGCEQVLGIQDPTPSSNPQVDAMAQPPRDAPGTGSGGDAPGTTGACAPVPTFASVVKYGAANSIGLAVGDVNRDSFKDVVVVTRTMTAGEVLIFNGSQNGTLGAPRPLRAGSPTLATGVLIADVDGDGSNDVVTWDGASPFGPAPPSNTVSVHRQNIAMAGTFLTAQTFSVPNLRGVVAGKLNGDNRPDLVIQTRSPDDTFPYFASTATAGAYTKGTLIDTGNVVSHVTDIDGDGLDDVAFARMAGGLAISFNNNAVTPGTFVSVAVGAGAAENASFGNYAGQGASKDVILFGHDAPMPGAKALYAQTAPRVFEERTVSGLDGVNETSVNTPGAGMRAVDINMDGKDDVIGPTNAELQCPTPFLFYPSKMQPAEIKLGDTQSGREGSLLVDINGNGKPDYLSLTGFTGVPGTFVEVWLQ